MGGQAWPPKLQLYLLPQGQRDDRNRPQPQREAVLLPQCKLSSAWGGQKLLRRFQLESSLKIYSGTIGTKEPRGSCTSAPNPVGPIRQWGSCLLLQRRGKRRGTSQHGCYGEQPGSLPYQEKATRMPGIPSVPLTLPILSRLFLLILATIVTLIRWCRPFSGSTRHDPQRVTLSLETFTLCCVPCLLQVLRCNFIEGKLGSGFWRPGPTHNNSTMWLSCSCTSKGKQDFQPLWANGKPEPCKGPTFRYIRVPPKCHTSCCPVDPTTHCKS